MTDDSNSVVHGYLDGQLTDEQVRELNDWIKEDPGHALEFASCALLHDRLYDHYRSRAVLEDNRLRGTRPKPGDHRLRRWGLAAAVLVGIGLAVLGWRVARRGQGGEVASLAEARDVVWGKGQTPIGVGTRVGLRDIRCASGTFKLVFDVGALVTLEGPADLRILSGNRILALRGRITAHVQGQAKGFTIETPNTLVVDQGTEFGVEINASGQTDVVVFQGLVDLAHSEPADRPAPIKRLGQGEGMRVGSAGALSRIVSIERRPGDDEWATGPSSDRGAVIRSVRDNIRGLGSSKYYQIVRRGLDDDAPAYVDRTHQWNGLDRGGLPEFLRGADYIMTFNEDKWVKDLSVTVELARAATFYVFYDTRLATPRWLPERFTDTGFKIGLDEQRPWPGGPPQSVGRGPGTSIDQVFSVWKCDLGPDETIDLGENGEKGNDSGNAMYGIAAVPTLRGNETRPPPPLALDLGCTSTSLSRARSYQLSVLSRAIPRHAFSKGETKCAVADLP
jgi:ferric-dicitrate binding protein FerR (iron transport regulator)